jgi:glycosyltransferase involved in cell wall biosynthesis
MIAPEIRKGWLMNFNEMSSNTAVADVPHLQNLQLEAFSQGNFQLAQRLSRSAIDIALGNALVLRERRESCEVSLIVVSYQCNDLTLELLEELAGFRFSFSHELILVLNNDEKLKALLNDRLFEKFVILDCPHNLGASGGRNAGAKLAKGRYLVFLDDDGFTRQSDIEALHEMAVQYDATGVRGRVLPRDGVTTPPTHYDMGDHLLPSIMDIEGITLWNRERFQLIGGFDELLFGHEGFELYARLYPRYGPCSFLYCPNARLIHDYSTPSKPNEAKQARYARNMAYLKWKGTPHTELLRSISRFRNDPIERSIFYSSLSEMLDIVDHQDNAADELVSVITTAKDAATFLADYTATLKAQTHQNFELIFIDDHSTDGTSQMISDLWSNDERLIYVKNDRTGRASALNLALSKARGEICVIADADDLMVPNRIRWSVRHLQNGDCVSGYIFNEEAAIRGTRPFVDQPTDIRLRRFAGMPVSFPSFAFKKARFRLLLPFARRSNYHGQTLDTDGGWL